MRLRLRGEGEAGTHGGPSGDLYVVLHVEPSKKFERDGQDLIVRKEITVPQAALGVTVQVDGLNGVHDVKVPKGTQSGTVFRLAGEGMPYVSRKQKGDLLVEITVVTPTRLSERQEELLREFEKAAEDNPLKTFGKKLGKMMGKK